MPPEPIYVDTSAFYAAVSFLGMPWATEIVKRILT